MVVIAAAIITRSGLPILSRQFLPISRQRMETLLSGFPKLLQPTQQHAYVETEEVRFLYQPLEAHFLVLVTNKASNILQDIDTLRLLGRVVAEYHHSTEEDVDLADVACEILLAFDEIVTAGYRVNVGGLNELHLVMAMESHEEKVQEIIAKNKMQEAKEAAKLKIKQIEIQKREAKKLAAASIKYPEPQKIVDKSSNAINITSAASSIKRGLVNPRAGKGMKLGSGKKL